VPQEGEGAAPLAPPTAPAGPRSQHRERARDEGGSPAPLLPRPLARPRSQRAVFADLHRWLRLHDLLASLDPDGPPAVRTLPAGWMAPARLGVLAGSFNPMTLAHTALAGRALTEGGLDAVAFALSVRIVDKERVTGAALEDRLLALELYVQRHPEYAVLVLNRGLYVDQAVALRAAFPALRELAFIVGYDKAVQIFDPRYYADRDAALERLFALATLLVAPRAGQGQAALAALLARPENRRFAGAVRWLPLPAAYMALSSTQVRQEAGSAAEVEAVPVETRALLAATRVYAPPRRLRSGEEVDAYAVRLALLDALARTRAWAESSADLAGLLRLALSPGRAGRAFRAWLRQPPAGAAARAADLAAFQACLHRRRAEN
jgi:nicotinamide-nucleotide adenylyltransferase